MLSREQTQILEQAIFLLFRLRDEQSQENWEITHTREVANKFLKGGEKEKAANVRQTTDENGGEVFTSPPLINDNIGFLEFTPQEILKMPKKFRNCFRTHGCTVPYRERKGDGRYRLSYEARYARKPFNNPPISVSAPTKAELKARFIEKLNNYVVQDDTAIAVPTSFDGFAMYWFENFHKAKVIEKTYKNNIGIYHRHIQDKLKDCKVKGVTPIMLKNLLKALPGNGKTEDDVHSILNQIFDTAVTHCLIKVNPLNLIVHTAHDTESGVELTIDEELYLLEHSTNDAYRLTFALMLYAGLRPSEIRAARIDGKFIVAVNSKRKNGKVEYKRIPIISHLRRYIGNSTTLELRSVQRTGKRFKSILPNHTPKDLRKTFNTRCIECHVETYARKKFMGHSVGKLDKTYSGTLEEYLLTEGKKLENWYIYPKTTPNFE